MSIASKLMISALALNVIILAPIVSGFLTGVPFVSASLGPLTDGRLVLTSVYASIALVSAMLIAMHLRGSDWAIPMTVAMFTVQIVYKAITVPLVGIASPVVIANVFVIIVQLIVLGVLITEKRHAAASTQTV